MLIPDGFRCSSHNMVGEIQELLLQDIPGHTNNIPAGIKRRSEPYHRQGYPPKIFRPLPIINLLSCQLGAVLFLKVHLVGRVSSHLYCGENRLPPSPVRILLPISRPQRSPGSIRANAVIREVFFFWIRDSANRQTTRTSYNQKNDTEYVFHLKTPFCLFNDYCQEVKTRVFGERGGSRTRVDAVLRTVPYADIGNSLKEKCGRWVWVPTTYTWTGLFLLKTTSTNG